MSNERECLARQWAENFKADILYDATMDELAAASEHILATTNPPTMDKVAWDVEKHVLAGARLHTDNDEQVDVVMLAKDVSIIDYTTLDGKHSYEHCSHFTPNGKRYKLVEVTVDEHPETLTTEEDYDNAPEGTVASMKGTNSVWVKGREKWWHGDYSHTDSYHMDDVPREVLRWGWGE